MKQGNWNDINSTLKQKINEIFDNYDISSLDSYQRRKIIFEYLCNELQYDYSLLEDIKNFNLYGKRITRNLYLELDNAIYNKKGICNAISQYYKLLLEQVGIYSMCVICDDGTSVNHQLNLVYNDITNNYSFDDITSVIVNRGTKDEYFDYDVSFANSVNQGNSKVLDDDYWILLPDEYINYLVGRDYNMIDHCITSIPSNIISSKGFRAK